MAASSQKGRDELANMGPASVSRVSFAGGQAILKQGVSATEMDFYRVVLPQSTALQALAPRLLDVPDEQSLIIEYLPTLLEAEQWRSPALLEGLAVLHNSSLTLTDCQRYPLTWSEQATESALARLDKAVRVQAARAIQPFWQQRERIFAPLYPLSGDSNIGNWGRRESGDWVLFDWERFSLGSPAIDLAPLLPGMSSPEQATEFGRAYLAKNPACTTALAQLTSQILVAKAWIAVEVINLLHERDNPRTLEYMAWFNRVLPSWLAENSRNLD
ncbi:phosphotransferase family protein [Ferrimonas marina]|uniref:Phosphotransferase enzyme family protein n=1 Tax=Ferrimonas marina TaxID=299255 RepID=A0A1M5XZU2_9GAMM|nr:phosphotransferase [Ferrimonas marina]SHI05335.1 Phosphotransferase enzyme family protein [Ferrimonas marina]